MMLSLTMWITIRLCGTAPDGEATTKRRQGVRTAWPGERMKGVWAGRQEGEGRENKENRLPITYIDGIARVRRKPGRPFPIRGPVGLHLAQSSRRRGGSRRSEFRPHRAGGDEPAAGHDMLAHQSHQRAIGGAHLADGHARLEAHVVGIRLRLRHKVGRLGRKDARPEVEQRGLDAAGKVIAFQQPNCVRRCVGAN